MEVTASFRHPLLLASLVALMGCQAPDAPVDTGVVHHWPWDVTVPGQGSRDTGPLDTAQAGGDTSSATAGGGGDAGSDTASTGTDSASGSDTASSGTDTGGAGGSGDTAGGADTGAGGWDTSATDTGATGSGSGGTDTGIASDTGASGSGSGGTDTGIASDTGAGGSGSGGTDTGTSGSGSGGTDTGVASDTGAGGSGSGGTDTGASGSGGTDTGVASDTGVLSDTGGSATDTGVLSDTGGIGTGDTAIWDTGYDTGDYANDGTNNAPDALPPGEVAARDALATTLVDLAGQVVDGTDTPLPGVLVSAGGEQATTDAQGDYRISGLHRHNVLVRFAASGWRTEYVPAWLYRRIDIPEVDLQTVVLEPVDPNTARFVFGGDTSLGGGFMDPSFSAPADTVPPDDPNALISSSDPLPGAEAVMASVAPWLENADQPVVNLENVVTSDPSTPHPYKAYHRFMLPEAAGALTALGVSYVTIGNDHVYDYLESGLSDTLASLQAAGIGWSGAGEDPASAWAPWRETVAGTPYSFVAATSMTGKWYPISYVADDTKGGAADLTSIPTLRSTVLAERDLGRVPIAVFHMGVQYQPTPTVADRTYAAEAVQDGAALVIAHSSHVIEGFGKVDGVPVAWGLGDLALPIDRLDATLGMLVQADLDGADVRGLQGLPVFVEHWVPRPVTGELADHALRLAAERSDVPTFPWADRLEVLPSGVPVDRDLTVHVHVPAQGWTVLDLRDRLQPGESLQHVDGPVTVRIGEDLLLYGNMEDQDVDGDDMEVPYWGVKGASRFPCVTGARRGVVGLCSVRSATNITPSVISFRNRIRVEGDAQNQPNKDLTVLGWVRGQSCGPLSVMARYMASSGDAVFGQQTVWAVPGGTFGWRPFGTDLHIPADVPGGDATTNPRAVRVFFRQDPPASGDGLVAWDDLAVISWQPPADATDGVTLRTPHARDFVRIEAAPGDYTLHLVLRTWERF